MTPDEKEAISGGIMLIILIIVGVALIGLAVYGLSQYTQP